MIKKNIILQFITVLITCFCFVTYSHANIEGLIVGYEDKFLSYDVGSGAKVTGDSDSKEININVYEIPTNQSLSLLFWAVDLYQLEDDKAVDLFASLNECEIYKQYHTDQFEWASIREATRKYLEKNKSDFPTRYEFAIPLKLHDYDSRRGLFNLAEDYEIISSRRFEVFSTDFLDVPCVITMNKNKSYPRALILEFSRPFTLTGIPMDEDLANDYIKRRHNYVKSWYTDPNIPMSVIYSYRDAVLIMKVKIFTHGKFLGLNDYDVQSVQMLGILEGFDIYEDITKENLLYTQNYTSNRDKTKLYAGLQEQYQLLRDKSAGKGMLH